LSGHGALGIPDYAYVRKP